jgi:oligopeptide/dipeptide ABC transporter ATP-binding protein
MSALLEVRDLEYFYGTSRGPVRAVDGVSFTLEGPGTAMGIVGESGCGKSSMGMAVLRVLGRSVARYAGSVKLEGRELMTLSDEEFRRQVRWTKLSMVFQGALNAFNPVVRVGEQIAEPLETLGGAEWRDKAKRRARAEKTLELVGLPAEVYTRYPHELSGGMKQRALIAMALIMDPQVVVLDEPTSALDVSVQAQVMNLLKRLKRELGLSLIFITHDIALASDICDTVGVAYAGRLVEVGSMEQVLADPQHPYTERLLTSVPRLHESRPPEFIPGSPPDLVTPPPGCRFHPRCPYRFEPCDKEDPPPFPAGEGHTARCWLAKGGGEAWISSTF